MLAYYSWETDESQLVPEAKRAATLARLAKACPAAEADIATRLALSAIVAAATAKDAKPHSDAAAADTLMKALADPAVTRENFDVLVNYAGKVTEHITLKGSPERARLSQAWTVALDRLYADTRLSALDRLAVLSAGIDLARIDDPKGAVPAALQERVRMAVAQTDRDTQDPYSRQAVISDAAQLLAEADLMAESDALLTAELARSHSPYYYMLGLADNAKKRGDKAAALDWAQKAYEAAKGPATRLQWGVRYVNMLIDLAPQDSARIEGAAATGDRRASDPSRRRSTSAIGARWNDEQEARRMEQGRRASGDHPASARRDVGCLREAAGEGSRACRMRAHPAAGRRRGERVSLFGQERKDVRKSSH